jgi:hypothetical protein
MMMPNLNVEFGPERGLLEGVAMVHEMRKETAENERHIREKR